MTAPSISVITTSYVILVNPSSDPTRLVLLAPFTGLKTEVQPV